MTDIALDAPRRDARVISLIGGAHCSSHFFQLVLPPLFPLMKTGFGVDFESLGLMMSVFFFISAIAQVLMGFIVDRFGAQRILPVGIACLGLAMLGIGFAQSYWMLLPLAALGGIGNSVFHPADYSVLTARVSPSRMARAYSVHTVSGTIGWTLAPITMLFLSQWLGWRGALMAVGVLGLLFAAFIATEHSELTMARHVSSGREARSRTGRRRPVHERADPDGLPLLRFARDRRRRDAELFSNRAAAGARDHARAGDDHHHGLSRRERFRLLCRRICGRHDEGSRPRHRGRPPRRGGARACHRLCAHAGPLAVRRRSRHGLHVGFHHAITRHAGARRDAAGSTGKVFGFVYSGLDLGSLVSPVVAGALIDTGHTPYVFVLIATALAATVGAAIAVKHNRHAR